jgi:WhiB family redox-sensing transcriptional regulator
LQEKPEQVLSLAWYRAGTVLFRQCLPGAGKESREIVLRGLAHPTSHLIESTRRSSSVPLPSSFEENGTNMSTVEYSAADLAPSTSRPLPAAWAAQKQVSLSRPAVRRRTPIGAEPEPDWRDSSACIGLDLNLFFPISTVGAAAQAQIEEAKAVCAECPVQRACLTWALEVGPEFGIFGGYTEAERRQLRQRTNPNARLITAVIPNPCAGQGEGSELN